MNTQIDLGKWTKHELDLLLFRSSHVKDTGERLTVLSSALLGTPYRAGTLKGDRKSPEIFVISLSAVDCFTFLDYLEAMRLTASYDEFVACLKQVRYRDGKVEFSHRNHFFTDWSSYHSPRVCDITAEIGGTHVRKVMKHLNKKGNDFFIPGAPVIDREIHYIPSGKAVPGVCKQLMPGDYAGIYSDHEGLDVSHVGIILKASGQTLLRHASSSDDLRCVTDEDFCAYLAGKPGFIVLRPRDL